MNLTRAALKAGMSHDEIFDAQQKSRDLIYNDAYIAVTLGRTGGRMMEDQSNKLVAVNPTKGGGRGSVPIAGTCPRVCTSVES